MRAAITLVILYLAVTLSAQMQFTQHETITIDNSAYSYAEMKNFQGEDRILVYSHTPENLFINVYDIYGNSIDVITIAAEDSTTDRMMSYYEYDGEGYLLTNHVHQGQMNFEGDGWTQYTYLIAFTYEVSTGENIFARNIGTLFSHEDNPVWSGTVIDSAHVQQPVTSYGYGFNEVMLTIPFHTESKYKYHSEDEWSYTNSTIMYNIIVEDDAFTSSFSSQTSSIITSGAIAGYPRITSGFTHFYSQGEVFFSNRKLWANDLIIDQTMFQSYEFISPFTLISDHYPSEPESFTMGCCDIHGNYTISERNLAGEVIWESAETNIGQALGLSCCFFDEENTPYTLYYGEDDSGYEIRNRLDGSILSWGYNHGWTPDYINRLEDQSMVMLRNTDNGIEVWHAAPRTQSGDAPAESPVFEMAASNFPNPFNPTTTITYSIPEDGEMSLKIYNTKGQLVKTLKNEYASAGNHEAIWNGEDRNGNPVSSGIYFYRLENASSSVINKMLLLK